MHLDVIDDAQSSDIHPPGQTASSIPIHITGISSWCGSLTSGRDEWIQSFLNSYSDGGGTFLQLDAISPCGGEGVRCLCLLTKLGPESLGHSLLSSQSQWSTHTLQSHRHLSGPAWEISRAFICFSSTVFLKSDLQYWYPIPQGTFLYLEVHETGTLCLVGNKSTWTQDPTKPRTCHLLRGQMGLSLISHTASGPKIILPTKWLSKFTAEPAPWIFGVLTSYSLPDRYSSSKVCRVSYLRQVFIC